MYPMSSLVPPAHRSGRNHPNPQARSRVTSSRSGVVIRHRVPDSLPRQPGAAAEGKARMVAGVAPVALHPPLPGTIWPPRVHGTQRACSTGLRAASQQKGSSSAQAQEGPGLALRGPRRPYSPAAGRDAAAVSHILLSQPLSFVRSGHDGDRAALPRSPVSAW